MDDIQCRLSDPLFPEDQEGPGRLFPPALLEVRSGQSNRDDPKL